MRATTLTVLAMILLPAAGAADTPVSGEIATNTRWEVANSPYVVQGTVDVTSNAVLAIDPGVTVKFDGFFSLNVQSGSALEAEGTPALPIVFTSNAPSPAPNDWYAVSLETSPGSVFTCCIFEYSRRGLILRRSSVAVNDCTFRLAQQYGMIVDDCSPTIDNCNVHQNSTGIYASQSSDPTNPVIHGCNFYDNTLSCLYLTGFADPPVVTLDAEGNWWGTADPGAIEDEIRHDVDVPTIQAHVDFDPWLGAAPVVPTTWSRLKAGYRN
jgi:hypothetical protein